MLKRADRSFNNSLGPNVYSDDKTALNYKALAYCIAGCKINNKRRYTSVNNICRAFGLFDPNEEKVNEIIKENIKEEAKFINIAPSSVTYNMKRNQPARGWKVEFID